MKKDDVLEVVIESAGMNGEGIARVDGMAVFVPYTLKGELVKIRIKAVKKSFAIAQVIKVLEPSLSRTAPDCASYFKCGGCDMMHVDKETERQVKIADIENNLLKIAGILRKVDAFIDSPHQTGYRNKAQFPFGVDGGKVVVGYYKANSHDFVKCSHCLLIGDWADSILDVVLEFCNAHKLSVYSERNGNGLLRHLILRKSGEFTAVTLVINGETLPYAEELSGKLPDSVSLYININKNRTNVISGKKFKTLKGHKSLPIEVLGVKASLAPDAFMQVNDELRDFLYRDAVSALSGEITVIDLYSGIGITSNLLAKNADKVYCIEIVESACRNAEETARINGNASKIDIICGDAAVEMPRLAEKIGGGVGVLLDPPRKGADESVLQSILKLNPAKIVYISCNPSTLARDLAAVSRLSVDAYEITLLNAYNMFPRTHHVETLAVLTRKNTKI